MKRVFFHHCGFGIIELIVAVSVIGVALLGGLIISQRSLGVRELSVLNVQASLLLGEGAEALRMIRDSGWATTSALAINTDYALSYDGVSWNVVPTASQPLVDNLFDRRFVFSSVYRDAAHRIVATGGTLDPDTRLATVSVSWKPYFGATTTDAVSLYLINIFN